MNINDALRSVFPVRETAPPTPPRRGNLPTPPIRWSKLSSDEVSNVPVEMFKSMQPHTYVRLSDVQRSAITKHQADAMSDEVKAIHEFMKKPTNSDRFDYFRCATNMLATDKLIPLNYAEVYMNMLVADKRIPLDYAAEGNIPVA